MSTDLKMPARLLGDGEATVSRIGDDHIAIGAVTGDAPGGITVSEYNAWRLFGMLSLILGLPLSKKVGKAIKLGGHELEATMGRRVPAGAPYGDRIAAALADEAMVEALRKQGYTVEETEPLDEKGEEPR